MGRKSITIARLASDAQRARTYKKRGKGIVKKASEIAVLCDIDVLLVMFSDTGKLDYFSSNPSIGNTIQRFIQEATKLQADDQEIERAVAVDDDVELMLLELQERMMDIETFNSEEEYNQLIQGLQNIHLMVANREQMQMQQPEAVPEAGMFDAQLAGMPMQQPQEGSLFGMEDLSSYLSLLGYEPITQVPDAAAALGFDGQPQVHEHMKRPKVEQFETGNVANDQSSPFGAQGNVYPFTSG